LPFAIRRPRRHSRSCVSSPLFLIILWSERRERNLMRLSRLEVQYARQMPGCAQPAGRSCSTRKDFNQAYAATEHLGTVWAYMGPRPTPPALPNAPALKLNEEEASVWVCQRQCNYLQAMEGDIDTSHLGFLHDGLAKGGDLTPVNRAPQYMVADTDCGVIYGAYRDLPNGQRNPAAVCSARCRPERRQRR
jgi:phenylpropionate dioxygenase-like ring-hydroxylating dioxygenase large terminal subunit